MEDIENIDTHTWIACGVWKMKNGCPASTDALANLPALFAKPSSKLVLLTSYLPLTLQQEVQYTAVQVSYAIHKEAVAGLALIIDPAASDAVTAVRCSAKQHKRISPVSLLLVWRQAPGMNQPGACTICTARTAGWHVTYWLVVLGSDF